MFLLERSPLPATSSFLIAQEVSLNLRQTKFFNDKSFQNWFSYMIKIFLEMFMSVLYSANLHSERLVHYCWVKPAAGKNALTYHNGGLNAKFLKYGLPSAIASLSVYRQVSDYMTRQIINVPFINILIFHVTNRKVASSRPDEVNDFYQFT
jgi:hypothetical protein